MHVTLATEFVSQGSYSGMGQDSHSNHELNLCHVWVLFMHDTCSCMTLYWSDLHQPPCIISMVCDWAVNHHGLSWYSLETRRHHVGFNLSCLCSWPPSIPSLSKLKWSGMWLWMFIFHQYLNALISNLQYVVGPSKQINKNTHAHLQCSPAIV